MKKESMIGRRLYAWLIDTLLLLVFVFFIDGLVSTPIMNNNTDIEQVLDSYVINSDIYNDLQDEYGFYIYDVSGNRIVNEDISEEDINKFSNDDRVIEITSKLYEEQKKLVITLGVRISLSILVASSLVYLLIPLIVGKGRTFGKLIAKVVLVNKNNDYAVWYQVLARYSLSIIFNIYLSIISLGIVPLINLIYAINQKDNKTFYDLICNTTIENGVIPLEVVNKIKE